MALGMEQPLNGLTGRLGADGLFCRKFLPRYFSATREIHSGSSKVQVVSKRLFASETLIWRYWEPGLQVLVHNFIGPLVPTSLSVTPALED